MFADKWIWPSELKLFRKMFTITSTFKFIYKENKSTEIFITKWYFCRSELHIYWYTYINIYSVRVYNRYYFPGTHFLFDSVLFQLFRFSGKIEFIFFARLENYLWFIRRQSKLRAFDAKCIYQSKLYIKYPVIVFGCHKLNFSQSLSAACRTLECT